MGIATFTAYKDTANRDTVTNKQEQQDLIRKKAYDLFLQRGCTPGREVDDWLQAEKLVDRQIREARTPEARPSDARTSAAAAAVADSPPTTDSPIPEAVSPRVSTTPSPSRKETAPAKVGSGFKR